MNDFKNQFRNLSPEKLNRVLEQLKNKKSPNQQQGQTSPIKSVARNEELLLSFAQQRLWFLNQLDPDSIAYNIPEAVKLEGDLNIKALTATLKEIIRRHEALRTNFGTENGQPVQIIHSEEDWNLPRRSDYKSVCASGLYSQDPCACAQSYVAPRDNTHPR
jgi:hypothetical protein